MVLHHDGVAVACGAIRRHHEDSAENKRMYVQREARGKGISRLILAELEATARRYGYTALVLETGLRQPEAIALYESEGYFVIPNFGFYKNSPLSVCYRKELDGPEPR
jgi:GNAT superfamily N-acetyltransferase